jgi:hypothetical protein
MPAAMRIEIRRAMRVSVRKAPTGSSKPYGKTGDGCANRPFKASQPR